MKTIVLSDMAILGSDVQDFKQGLKKLYELQRKGIKLIWLSNRPENCMRMIGAKVLDDESVTYEYLGASVNRGDGIAIVTYGNVEQMTSQNICPDYIIYGNGICTLDRDEELIRQDEFLKRATIDEMIEVFEDNGYHSMERLKRDTLGDRCFGKGEDVYKFFNPENGVAKPNNRVYGMQCSGRGSEADSKIMNDICYRVKDIRSYRLNGKPCFYHKDVNKYTSLIKLLDHEDMKVDDCHMILSELTDDVLLREFPKLCETVRGEMCPQSTKTLAKVLNEIG